VPRAATPAVATACATLALAAALAATGTAHHGSWAAAQGLPAIELLHAGATVVPPLVELHASPEPAVLELVARGVGKGAEVSVRSVRSSHWGDASGGAPPALHALADHGGGEATLTVDRSSPGELVLEATASGEARALYVIRVLDALRIPGYRDGAAPSRIVGHVDPADPHISRILAQAGRPLCAQVDASGMSGVPPIEGTGPKKRHKAAFGQQVTQWVHLDAYRGHDRLHYYMQFPPRNVFAEVGYLKSPYTNTTETFASFSALPRAAAPGPYWGDRQHAIGGGTVNLHYRVNGTEALVAVRVNATSSFVPELLPLDGVMRILATAFHTDAVTFSLPKPPDYGDHLRLKPPPGSTHAMVNSTDALLGPGLSTTVRVSDIALQNGILIEGITDGEGTEGATVKKIHEITLAVDLPVDVGDTDAYEHVEAGLSVAPWECWPLLNGNALVP